MSELRADTITGSDGISPVTLTKQSAAKAWINLNGPTGSARDSFNLSSNIDHASGEFSTNVISAFVNINYSNTTSQSSNTNASNRAYTFIGMHQLGGSGTAVVTPTTTAYRFLVSGGTTLGTNYDALYIDVHTMGDLA